MRNYIKKTLLKNFIFADILFFIIKKLPKSLRKLIIFTYFLFPKHSVSFPSRLTVFLTDKCNMKCAHCFIIKEIPKETQEISLIEYKKIFKSLKGRTSQILFTGGEPTLRKDLFELCYYAYTLGKVSTISIFSNSLYPDKTEFLLEKILNKTKLKINYQTSLDGNKKFHDFNRKVNKSYDKVIETINKINNLKKKYKNRLSRVVVGIAISKQNLSSISNLIDTLLPLGCFLAFGFVRKSKDVYNIDKKFINFEFTPEEFDKDGNIKFGNNYLNDSDLDYAIEILDKKVWSKHPDQMIYAYQKTTLIAKQILEKYSKSPISSECSMGYEDMIILPNGKIARCEMLSSYSDLSKFDFDLNKFIVSEEHKMHLKQTSGCYCTHECGIGVSIMNDKQLLNTLIS